MVDSLNVPPRGSRSPSPNSRGLLKYFKRGRADSSGRHRSGSSSSISSKYSSVMSSPKVDNGGACSFTVGVAEDRNLKCRRTMEDAHTFIYNFGDRTDCGYFAVFDGHAGGEAAEWCAKNVHELLDRALTKDDEPSASHSLATAFQEADNQIAKLGLRNSGCTAAVALLRWEEDKKKRMLYVANVGDTRVVLCRGGRAFRLTYDHKGSDAHEGKRVANAGGVILNNRVNGVLAVTRSLGDSYMKDFVTGSPYTTATELEDQDEFLIIACDGLWDVCDDETAVRYIREIGDPKQAAQKLVDYALNHFSSDNLTCMVIRLADLQYPINGTMMDEQQQHQH